jgi:hypothetical protein
MGKEGGKLEKENRKSGVLYEGKNATFIGCKMSGPDAGLIDRGEGLKAIGSEMTATGNKLHKKLDEKSVEINQNNQHGDNKIEFTIAPDFTEETKEFKKSDQITEFLRKSRRDKIVAYVITFLLFILSPFYGHWIYNIFFTN